MKASAFGHFRGLSSEQKEPKSFHFLIMAIVLCNSEVQVGTRWNVQAAYLTYFGGPGQ